MQPAFETEQLRVYRLTQIDNEFPFAEGVEVESFIGVLTRFPKVAAHASLSKLDGVWSVEAMGLTGGFEVGGYEDVDGVEALLLEFFTALEEYVDAPMVLDPWDDNGEELLKLWRPDDNEKSRGNKTSKTKLLGGYDPAPVSVVIQTVASSLGWDVPRLIQYLVEVESKKPVNGRLRMSH